MGGVQNGKVWQRGCTYGEITRHIVNSPFRIGIMETFLPFLPPPSVCLSRNSLFLINLQTPASIPSTLFPLIPPRRSTQISLERHIWDIKLWKAGRVERSQDKKERMLCERLWVYSCMYPWGDLGTKGELVGYGGKKPEPPRVVVSVFFLDPFSGRFFVSQGYFNYSLLPLQFIILLRHLFIHFITICWTRLLIFWSLPNLWSLS